MSPADRLEALALGLQRGELDGPGLEAELDAFDLAIEAWAEQLLNLPLPPEYPQAGELLEAVRESLQLLADASASLRADPSAVDEAVAQAREAEAVLGQLRDLAARNVRELEDQM